MPATPRSGDRDRTVRWYLRFVAAVLIGALVAPLARMERLHAGKRLTTSPRRVVFTRSSSPRKIAVEKGARHAVSEAQVLRQTR
jgi:hypothetical protein